MAASGRQEAPLFGYVVVAADDRLPGPVGRDRNVTCERYQWAAAHRLRIERSGRERLVVECSNCDAFGKDRILARHDGKRLDSRRASESHDDVLYAQAAAWRRHLLPCHADPF